MWNIPTSKRLNRIPRLYETEKTPLKDKKVFLHFFIGGSDWFAMEFDGEDIFFGFAILNNDFQNAEFGYFSFKELKELKVDGWVEVDCELEELFPVQRAVGIEKIREAQGWKAEAKSPFSEMKISEPFNKTQIQALP